MESVLVVGAGFMGAGIAQVCAQSGLRVYLMDVSPRALVEAREGMALSLGKLRAKGLVSEMPEQVLDRVKFVPDLSPARNADWVVEAAPERESLKLELFRELDRLAPETTPLGSNTSSIPINRLASATACPGRVLGLHFFGPVPLMALVEVIQGPATDPEVFERGLEFIRSLSKTPVQVRADIPGFVMNRVFSAAFGEALELVAQGVTTPRDVDTGMKLGYGWRSGPFEIADNAGLDTVANIDGFLRSMGEEKLAVRTDLLNRLVARGRLGRKAGRGFYDYGPDGKRLDQSPDDWQAVLSEEEKEPGQG
jgi:3-hydroxybutyryl-CoA dehydrogenase